MYLCQHLGKVGTEQPRQGTTALLTVVLRSWVCPPYLYKKRQAEGGLAQPSPLFDDRQGILSSPGYVRPELEQKGESGLPTAHWTREQRRIN